MKAHPAIIIQPDESRGLPPPAAEKGVQHEFVKRIVAREGRGAIPGRIRFVGVEKSPVFGDADFRFPARVAFAPDDVAGLHMGAGHVVDHFAELSQFPFALRRKSAKQIRQARVGVRFVECIPKINTVFQRGDEPADEIHECRNRCRVGPAAHRINPRWIGKMMQHDHRCNARQLEPVEQIHISRQFVLIQGGERRGLQPRPFDAEAISVYAEPDIHPMSSG